MRTRCLECEASTYRSETFTNIDIPLTFDEGSSGGGDSRSSGLDDSGNGGDTGGGGGGRDESAGQAMFLKQIMASETLRENNKYWCSECSRLNEAQRYVTWRIFVCKFFGLIHTNLQCKYLIFQVGVLRGLAPSDGSPAEALHGVWCKELHQQNQRVHPNPFHHELLLLTVHATTLHLHTAGI